MLAVPGVQGPVEEVHLAARVVQVVLLLDFVTRRLHDGGEGAAEYGASGVAHVQRTCRVHADELHLDPSSTSEAAVSVLFAFMTDGVDLFGKPAAA